MVSNEHQIVCVIEAQANGLNTYMENLVELKNALDEIIAIEGNRTLDVMRIHRIRAEMERQLEGSREILNELEQLKWTVVPLAPPPDLYE